MSSPFCRNYWGVPSHSQPSVRGIPEAKVRAQPSSKVISIPVHFVGSERSRSDSALKIQKVFRGFQVRKNIKKIAAIRNEVRQIERKVSEQDTVDLIKRDAKERLRLNETLMNLLLRLDSVTSVDAGVKGCRKSVIKMAIALQEKLDLITSSHDDQTQDQGEVDAGDVSQKQNVELHDEAANCGHSEDISENEALVKQDEVPDPEDVRAGNGSDPRELGERVEESEVMPNSEIALENPKLEASTPTVDPPLENEKMIIEAKGDDMKETANDAFFAEESVGTSHTGEQSGTSTAPGIDLIEGSGETSSLQKNEGTDMVPVQSDDAEKDVGRREDQNRNMELLERLMEDNERMMGMMAELFKRNAMQTRLLSSLSQRVDQLEKAFACEKLRRKKKRNSAAAVDGSYKLPDTKKCDKKH